MKIPFELKYKLCLWNSYFDKGMSLTKYIKYLLFIAGLSSGGKHLPIMIILGAMYLTSNFFIGWLWFRYKWIEAEAEVGNRHNILSKQLRRYVKKNE